MTDAAATLLARLAARGWSIGVAESLTGGLVAARITSVPGASEHMRGGVVAYATDLKRDVLDVPAALLAERGAVDPDVAQAMADGIRRVAGADVGVSTTGVAGPDPQDGKPVGTVYIAVSTPVGGAVEALALSGTRAHIRDATVDAALSLCAAAISVDA
ncbi:CinA family protein [Microbacterium thalassium]|uniref:Nicotinamide-nucleotide amidase n=1 Tax=Microbacterium thalassium TaxID=362649 RepID=A0A7X0FPX2_9MICO|nr:nicotinamide-nucleotide amidohydrolase family protein [Microbacterium thalassium]MBB6391520.1 nicotinamide-nucleotide amidase [Microbacterium thalassium]GLK24086.1 competence damage-inducible protein A [Microbacterium thalassium]